MNDTCRRCGVALVPGRAIKPTLIAAESEFGRDDDLTGRTLTAGGPGELVDVLKCPACGYSRTYTPEGAQVRIYRGPLPRSVDAPADDPIDVVSVPPIGRGRPN